MHSSACAPRITFKSIEDATHTDEGEGAARVGDQHGIRPELKYLSSNLILAHMIILYKARVALTGSREGNQESIP